MTKAKDTIEDIVFDGNERIEIACSYPDAETAIKALDDFDNNTN